MSNEQDQTQTPEQRGFWMKLLGLKRRGPERRRLRFVPVAPTLWGWLLIVMIVAGLGMGGFAEYSMQHDFCRSCHLMEPYYKAWHESTHNNVECVQCHFEPGLQNTLKGKWEASTQAVKYITNTYGSMPHAEVRDESCMREGCHEKRLLEGKVNWDIKTPTGQTVTIKFDHTPHLTETRRGKQLRCVSCHSQIVQGQHLVVTVDTCFLCHFKGYQHGRYDETLGGCEACHDAPKQSIQLTTGTFEHNEFLSRGVDCMDCHSDALRGDGKVERQVCWNCHNRAQDAARFGESKFVHEKHVTEHKVECRNCHEMIDHSLSANSITAGMPTFAPGSPHDIQGLSATGSCAQCHEAPHGGPVNLYRGTGGRGVPDMPSIMYQTQVDCIACHRVTEFGSSVAQVSGQTFIAAQTSCNHCHGDKYQDQLQQWRDSIDKLLLEAEPLCARAHELFDAAQIASDEKLKLHRLLDDADYNLNFVKLGLGIHNVTYATALINITLDNSRQVIAALEPQP
ncbi:MAG: NapC/NirT family cytochrome c [Phycisphaeraceae bacterium]|nr:NapC/NirT family cytochrome c [Phycisphaeraceae bacterium]